MDNFGCVQVFFPAETSDQAAPPKWFFDQSPSQVKAAFLAKRKKTELDQVCQIQPHSISVSELASHQGNLLHNAEHILPSRCPAVAEMASALCSRKSRRISLCYVEEDSTQ